MSSVNTESQDKGAVESSPKLPDVIDPTLAADSLREHTATLVKAFRHCLSSLADSLYSQSIIPEDAHRKAQRESLDEDERSRALVSCVEARLEIKPSDFKKFIDILKSEPFFDTLGDKLVQSYCNLSSAPTNRCRTTTTPAISHYATYLKGVYRNSPISSDSKWPPTPSKKYVNLATVKHGYDCRDQFIGHTLHGNIKEVLKSRKEISINEILVPDEDVVYLKLVLIEGAPGIGKSTLAWELCRRWEQGCMEKYSLTVLLRLREKEVQEIRSINELFRSIQSKYKDDLLDEVSSSNGKGILFILDGFDELPTIQQKEGFLADLIRGIFLPECTVLVTSRSSATAEFLTICRPQLQKRIEVLGFTQESVEEYANSIFSCEPEQLQRFKTFISASKNPAINSLMYVPLNASIIVEIYRHSKSDHLLPHTLTQVYIRLCLTILKRFLQQTNPLSVEINKFKDLPCHLYQEFLKVSEVACDGMKKQEVIFHTLPSDLVHFGFLDAIFPLYGGGSVSYNFLHLTLQEFFAAYHISQLCGDARLALLRECGRNKNWDVVWRFVAGLSEFKFFERHLNCKLFVKGSEENNVYVKPLFIQCLFEANIKTGWSKLLGLKNIVIDTTYNMLPLDFYALGYCIANLTSEVSWSLEMMNNSSINIFISGLKTSNVDNGNISRLHIQSDDFIEFSRGPHYKNTFPHLKSFPLCGITDLDLDKCSLSSPDHLTTLLPSMTSLKRLNISSCTFPDFQCTNEFLQQLSQTNVTSLDIRDINLTKCTSAIQPLIDPLTGTLEELCIGGNFYENTFASGYSSTDDDALLLDMVCAPSSLKSLKLLHPHKISSLTQLQTNTCLTKLEIKICSNLKHSKPSFPPLRASNFHPQVVEVIVGILEHNATLKHLTVGEFTLMDSDTRRYINAVAKRSSTLKRIVML